MDYERPILLTNYWEQSPFSEANTSMATQEDPALYGNQRCSVTCHSQKREAKVYNLKLSHKETQTVEHILLSRNTNCWTQSAIKFLCLMLKADKNHLLFATCFGDIPIYVVQVKSNKRNWFGPPVTL